MQGPKLCSGTNFSPTFLFLFLFFLNLLNLFLWGWDMRFTRDMVFEWRSGGPKGCQAEPHTHMGKKKTHDLDFLMVIMASGIACGRVCMKAETESCNMAAIIQIIA